MAPEGLCTIRRRSWSHIAPVHSVPPARAPEEQEPITDSAQMTPLGAPQPTASWAPSGHQSSSRILGKGTQPCSESRFVNDLVSSVRSPARCHRALEDGRLLNGCGPVIGIPRLSLIRAHVPCSLAWMGESGEPGAVYPLQVYGSSVAHARQAKALSSRDQNLGHEAGALAQQPEACSSKSSLYTSTGSPQETSPAGSSLFPSPGINKAPSTLWFASLRASSCPRHCSERGGAQFLTSTPALHHPGLGAARHGPCPHQGLGWGL